MQREGRRWVPSLAHRVSCRACNQAIVLAQGARDGDAIRVLRAALSAHIPV
jgi:hypothetical protein